MFAIHSSAQLPDVEGNTDGILFGQPLIWTRNAVVPAVAPAVVQQFPQSDGTIDPIAKRMATVVRDLKKDGAQMAAGFVASDDFERYVRAVNYLCDSVTVFLERIRGQYRGGAEQGAANINRQIGQLRYMSTQFAENATAGDFYVGVRLNPGTRKNALAGEFITAKTLWRYMTQWAKSVKLEKSEFKPGEVGYIPFFIMEDGICFVPGGVRLTNLLGRSKPLSSKGEDLTMTTNLVKRIDAMREKAAASHFGNFAHTDEIEEIGHAFE